MVTIPSPESIPPHQTLAARLVRIMTRIKRMEKEGFNKHHGYKFVTDEQVFDYVRPMLADEGIAVFCSVDRIDQQFVERDGERPFFHTVIHFRFTLATEMGETRDCIWIGESNNQQDKGAAQAATLAMKYWLLKTLLISSGDQTDDPDYDAGNSYRAQRQQRSAPRQTESQPRQRPAQQETPAAASDSADRPWFTQSGILKQIIDATGKQPHEITKLTGRKISDFESAEAMIAAYEALVGEPS
jgi:hypothetical protein